MWARRDFAEPHLIAFDEQLDTEHATTAQRLGHRLGDALGLGQCGRAHGLWLPGFLIVALLLTMANRRAEGGAANVAHGQQRDFVIEVDKAFNDHATLAGTTAFLRVIPGFLNVIDTLEQALPFTRRTHDRLDHTREAEVFDGLAVRLEGVGKVVRRGRQLQLFSGQTANAFTVHGQLRSTRGRNHREAFGLKLHKRSGGDGFDFRDDKVRFFKLDDSAQGNTVKHVDHMAAMSDLHRRRVLVTVNSDHFNAQALQFDHDFLAQFAAAAEQYASRGRRQWSSDSGHLKSS